MRGPVESRLADFGEHMTDIDLRSRENSNVKSLLISSANLALAALHKSVFESLLKWKLNFWKKKVSFRNFSQKVQSTFCQYRKRSTSQPEQSTQSQ